MSKGRTTDVERPRLLFVTNEVSFFASHFRSLAGAARRAGFHPVLAARGTERSALDLELDVEFAPRTDRPRAWSKYFLAPSIAELRRTIRRVRPSVMHCLSVESIIVAGIAAQFERVPSLILAPTGLGYAWAGRSMDRWIMRNAIRSVINRLAARSNVHFVFENRDDPVALGLLKRVSPTTVFVSGAGVDPEQFPVLDVPRERAPLRVAVIARMVVSKGIEDAVIAVGLARAAGHDVTLELWGEPDLKNPRSHTAAELEAFALRDGVSWHGWTRDPVSVWGNVHVAMLLSHGGEGLPRCLVEAMACARPVITTNVPGCRDCIDGNGILVPPRDPAAAARALAELASDPRRLKQMGAVSRQIFLSRMTSDIVTGRIGALYCTLAQQAKSREL